MLTQGPDRGSLLGTPARMLVQLMGVRQLSSKNRGKTTSRPSRPSVQQKRKGGKPDSRWWPKRYIVGAAGIMITALLTLVATGVIPKITGQFVNGPQLEDRLRPGPEITVNESVFNPFEGVPLLPKVAPGSYQPARKLISALAHPMAATSYALQKQIRDAGGVSIQYTYIRLVLQGNRNEPILILNVHPVQLRRTHPLNGVLFDVGPQGEANTIQMGFDLDQLALQALSINKNTLTKVPYFQSHSIRLADGEQAVLVVQAQTFCYSAQFKLAIDYEIGGQSKEVIISNNGGPFEVTGYRLGRNDVISYRKMFFLQNDFSVSPPSPSQLYTRAGVGASSCPT